MTVGNAERPQQCHKYFFNIVHLLLKDLRFTHGGVKFPSCPGCQLTSLRPEKVIVRMSERDEIITEMQTMKTPNFFCSF